MTDKIISVDTAKGPFNNIYTRVMQMVPNRDKNDIALQRLIAFRLKSDGEEATRQFLINKIREMIRCAYTGRLYEFIKNDVKAKECGIDPENSEPPDIA